MSNKSKRSRNARRNARKRNLAPVVILAGILVVAVAGVLFATNQSTPNQPAVPVTVQGSPRLQIDQALIDFGDVPVGEMVKASFNLSNTGDQPLVFSHPPVPTVVEGC